MKTVKLVHTINEVRGLVEKARRERKSIGLVPTMGALHEGHTSLIKAAAKECDFVIVSIFVNPSQFGPNEDFAKYPRTLEADIQVCSEAGADVVFAPSAEEMYPREQLAWVEVEKITAVLCGAARPGHFRGVATVCAKLFNIVQPDKAYFGQKDAQQVVVIKRMVADLNMLIEIVVCPIVREPGGLAMSSRNKYLSEQQRAEAATVYNALTRAAEMVNAGERKCVNILAEMKRIFERTRAITIEYIHIVDVDTLEELDTVDRKALIAVAVRLGSTRLIDNIIIDGRV